MVCDLDVGLKLPVGEEVARVKTVRLLKFYMIWVQVGVSQTGFYLIGGLSRSSTKGPGGASML